MTKHASKIVQCRRILHPELITFWGDSVSSISCSIPTPVPTHTSEQVLRLALGMVYGHSKAIGASEGPAVLQQWSRPWTPLFSRPTPRYLLPVLRGLLEAPGDGLAAEVVSAFGPTMLGAAGRVVQASYSSAYDEAKGSGQGVTLSESDDDVGGRALGLLVDICTSAAAAAGPGWGMLRTQALPLLLTAQPGGVKLATLIRHMAAPPPEGLLLPSTSGAAAAPQGEASRKKRKTERPSARPTTIDSVALNDGHTDDGFFRGRAPVVNRLWCAVQLLPHACETPAQAVHACQAVQAAAEAALSQPGGSDDRESCAEEEQRRQVLLLLHGTATQMLATLIPSSADNPDAALKLLSKAASSSVTWLLAHSGSFWAAKAAGSMLTAAREMQTRISAASSSAGGSDGPSPYSSALSQLLSESSLKRTLPNLLPLLSSRSQAVRAAALCVLSAYDTPALLPLGTDAAAGRNGTTIKLVNAVF